MKIIWTFTLMMIPGVVSVMNVTGYSGDGVKFTCRFEGEYKTNARHFCKGDQRPGCSDLIKTTETNKWVDSGRFSLYDNTSASVLKVTIRNLSEEDSGTYYCGVNKTGIDRSTEVNLKVLTGQQIRTVIGYPGGNVSISLKYELKDKNSVKVCKYADTVKNTNRRAECKHDRRFSVHDDRSPGLSRLFIRDLNENDSGKYRITVKVSENYRFFSEFNLNITDEVPEIQSLSTSPSPPPSSSSSSSSSSSPSPSPSSASSVSSVKTSPFTGVSRTSSILSASPKTSAGSSLIVPLVLVLLVLVPLVLIIAGLLLLFLFKKHQSRGGDLNSQTGPEKHEVVTHTGYTHKQLPTSPSVSPDCVYATVDKATGDSQRCITSAEDLNYAVVNFHKKSDCPDSVNIRNNQDYSEYAAVNHLSA